MEVIEATQDDQSCGVVNGVICNFGRAQSLISLKLNGVCLNLFFRFHFKFDLS